MESVWYNPELELSAYVAVDMFDNWYILIDGKDYYTNYVYGDYLLIVNGYEFICQL
jgi:hypothetical protein